jgi:hypothetical protein
MEGSDNGEVQTDRYGIKESNLPTGSLTCRLTCKYAQIVNSVQFNLVVEYLATGITFRQVR